MVSFKNQRCLYCNKSVPTPDEVEDSRNWCRHCNVIYCVSSNGNLWRWFFTARVGMNLFRIDFISNENAIVTIIKRVSKYDYRAQGYILYDTNCEENLILCEPTWINLTPRNAKEKLKTILTFL